MRASRRDKGHANRERWLVSYADFITLLFAFFVVLFSSSQVDKRKVGALATAIQAAFQDMGIFSGQTSQTPLSGQGAVLPTARVFNEVPMVASMIMLERDLTEALNPEIRRKEVALRVGKDGLVVSLREVGFFESGSATVKLKSQPSLERLAKILVSRPYDIRIEGHTDNVPIHSNRFASNWELSAARATAVVRLFIEKYQFPPARISAAGYGEFHPVASNDAAEGRMLNRRVDIVVLTQRNPALASPIANPISAGLEGTNEQSAMAPLGSIPERPTQ
jgi:chemotaxis protein MotB